MSVPIQPLADYILAKEEVAEEKSAGGIFIVESARKKPDWVTVVAVGPEVKSIKNGDKVMYIDEYGKTKNTEIDKQTHVIFKEAAVIAIVK